MSMTFKVENVAKTIAGINSFDEATRKKFDALSKETAMDVRKKAKAAAPVGKTSKNPGSLKRSIGYKKVNKGATNLAYTVTPRAAKGGWHKAIVMNGTGQRRNKHGANRGRMPANDFQAQAEQAAQGAFDRKIKKIIEEKHEV